MLAFLDDTHPRSEAFFMPPSPLPFLPTVRNISRAAGRERHHVNYAIRKLGVEPINFAGNTRLFSEDDARRVLSELAEMPGPRALNYSPTLPPHNPPEPDSSRHSPTNSITSPRSTPCSLTG